MVDARVFLNVERGHELIRGQSEGSGAERDYPDRVVVGNGSRAPVFGFFLGPEKRGAAQLGSAKAFSVSLLL